MGGPENNPLPPACSPELPNTDAAADSQDGQQRPANKLARVAEKKAGGPGTPAGRKAFRDSLIKQFDKTYARAGSFWTAAPSDPTPYGLFDNAPTYERPGAAYIALWQILGTGRFTKALRQIQRHYGGGNITESQLEAGFRHWLPNKSAACRARLSQFFTQWFDTAYPSGGGTSRPAITGPGLAGPGFYDSSCPAWRGPSGGPAPGDAALEPGDGLALGRGVRAFPERQRLDRAVEPVAARAADPGALQRAVRRPHQVAAFHLGGQPAAG